jgi:hypothetical protein
LGRDPWSLQGGLPCVALAQSVQDFRELPGEEDFQEFSALQMNFQDLLLAPSSFLKKENIFQSIVKVKAIFGMT